MRTHKSVFLVIAVILIAFVHSGCDNLKGPEGPEGPEGPPGECCDDESSDPTLTVSSPVLDGGEAGESYDFTFTATNLPSELDEIVFAWTLGTGAPDASGSEQVSVSGREATHQISYTYASEGMYSLVVVAEDTDENVVAEANEAVTIGDPDERELELDICDTWKAAAQGGQGVTVDNWDISQLPTGAEFDIRFDAYSIPDKYVVEYDGDVVYDSGWRGSPNYDGDPMYPGGVTSPGSGQEDGIFTKVSGVDTFTVTVFGPQSGTLWEYDIRARCD